MRHLALLVAASLVGGAASPVPPRAFALDCVGSSRLVWSDVHKEPLVTSAAIKSFRVDVSRRRWCQDVCDRLFRIHGFAANKIDLISTEHFSYGLWRVDARRWTYTGSQLTGDGAIIDMMTCIAQPFARFPRAASLVA
jgi:hypothetical protein